METDKPATPPESHAYLPSPVPSGTVIKNSEVVSRPRYGYSSVLTPDLPPRVEKDYADRTAVGESSPIRRGDLINERGGFDDDEEEEESGSSPGLEPVSESSEQEVRSSRNFNLPGGPVGLGFVQQESPEDEDEKKNVKIECETEEFKSRCDSLTLLSVGSLDEKQLRERLTSSIEVIKGFKSSAAQYRALLSHQELQNELLTIEAHEASQRHEVENALTKRELERINSNRVNEQGESLADVYRRRLKKAKARLREYDHDLKVKDREIEQIRHKVIELRFQNEHLERGIQQMQQEQQHQQVLMYHNTYGFPPHPQYSNAQMQPQHQPPPPPPQHRGPLGPPQQLPPPSQMPNVHYQPPFAANVYPPPQLRPELQHQPIQHQQQQLGPQQNWLPPIQDPSRANQPQLQQINSQHHPPSSPALDNNYQASRQTASPHVQTPGTATSQETDNSPKREDGLTALGLLASQVLSDHNSQKREEAPAKGKLLSPVHLESGPTSASPAPKGAEEEDDPNATVEEEDDDDDDIDDDESEPSSPVERLSVAKSPPMSPPSSPKNNGANSKSFFTSPLKHSPVRKESVSPKKQKKQQDDGRAPIGRILDYR